MRRCRQTASYVVRASEQTILIWNHGDGRILRVLHGHTKSVVSLHTGEGCVHLLCRCASGDLEEEIDFGFDTVQ